MARKNYSDEVVPRRLQAAGGDGTWVLVRPLDLRWPMHWVETGLHLVLAAVVLALLFVRACAVLWADSARPGSVRW